MNISNKRDDGKSKNSLDMLQELFSNGFRPFDGSDTGCEIVDIWKNEIYKHRNAYSHSFIDDVYDIKIFEEYRQTINEAYKSIRLIRLVLSTFPIIRKSIEDKTIEISDDLYYGNIHIYFSPLKISDTNQ